METADAVVECPQLLVDGRLRGGHGRR